MNVIDQMMLVNDWPLEKTGDRKFFGYVVALGVFPCDQSETGLDFYQFADFYYGEEYSRYRLPHDQSLFFQLREHLSCNFYNVNRSGHIWAKVWITKTEDGYIVELP